MEAVIGGTSAQRLIDGHLGDRSIGVIRYARVWKDRKEEVEPRDAFFEAMEAPELIEERFIAPAKPVSVRNRANDRVLKTAQRRNRQIRLHRPSLITAVAV